MELFLYPDFHDLQAGGNLNLKIPVSFTRYFQTGSRPAAGFFCWVLREIFKTWFVFDELLKIKTVNPRYFTSAGLPVFICEKIC